jgi:TetR/AcrR family transcriptional regulator, cholesterol catabolism regulator
MTEEGLVRPAAEISSSSGEAVTRDRILNEAARLFRHRGYAATPLRDIAAAAGIKAGSIYYHFESKEDILGEVLDRGMQLVFDVVRQRVESLPAGAKWIDRIGACIEGHLWGMLHHGDFTTANIRMYGQLPASAKNRNRAIRLAYAAYWDRLFDGAISGGEMRADTSAVMLRLFVLGALNWTVEWYNPQRGPFDEFARQMTAFVFDGVVARADLVGTTRSAGKRPDKRHR